MSGQLQLLCGPVAQLLSRMSMALAPAPACIELRLQSFSFKQMLHTGLHTMS